MNSPEYTTSAPVIGPLIMCSGLRVSAKPYHPRHRVAPSSRVVVARQSIDRSLESRLVSSRLVLPRASSPRVVSSRIISLIPHHHPSIIIARRLGRSSRSRRSRLSRRSHREHESPIRHRSPKMRRLRSRRSVDEGTNRHDRAVAVLSVPRRALPPRGRLSLSVSQSVINHPLSFMHARCARTARMETRGTGRASNGREITRWSARGDVAIGADRGCVVVEVRTARATNATRECMT